METNLNTRLRQLEAWLPQELIDSCYCLALITLLVIAAAIGGIAS